MKDFKPLKNLENVRNIQVGDIIGMGQLITKTIPALCVAYEGGRISALGNMDNRVILKYNFVVEDVVGFYDDSSIKMCYDDKKVKDIEKGSAEYELLRGQLISAGIWRVRE